MITETALKRVRILDHWKKHGLQSTIDAFEVSERTLWNWKSRFNGKPESLNPRKRLPQKKRRRIWDPRILDEIRRLRSVDVHPNLGKEKIHPLLEDFCDAFGLGECPSPMTIGRLIHDMGGLRTSPQKVSHFGKVKKTNRHKVLRKPKDLTPSYPGHVVALDTIEKQRHGRKMYILTAIDIYTRTTFAIATRSHASKTCAHFFSIIMEMFPYEITHVLTDNGSEFKKYLDQLLQERGIVHYHTYPKTPKMNAHCESFNGTIQDEFVDFNSNLLFDDTTRFNEKMAVYLTFYNTQRVHYAFKNKKTPLEVLLASEYYMKKLPRECKHGWTYALAGIFQKECYNAVITLNIAGSSNGRTSPSGGEYLGSSPSPATKKRSFLMRG